MMTPMQKAKFALDLGQSILRLAGLVDFEEQETKRPVLEDTVYPDGSALAVEAEYLANAILTIRKVPDATPEQYGEAYATAVHWIGHVSCLRGMGLFAITAVGTFATRGASAPSPASTEPVAAS